MKKNNDLTILHNNKNMRMNCNFKQYDTIKIIAVIHYIY